MLDRATELAQVMAGKSADEIRALMKLSPRLAALNAERFEAWDPDHSNGNCRPAVLAFNGDTYQGIDAPATFGERDYTHAQKTLRILSGLYGVLRPLDAIQPYRLEMGTKLTTDRGSDLYSFWSGQISDALAGDLERSPGSNALVNLASNEYFSAVEDNRLDTRVVTPKFLDSRDGAPPKVISFFAKRARGAMAGWMVRERVTSVRRLREFDGLGYHFEGGASEPGAPVFLRVT